MEKNEKLTQELCLKDGFITLDKMVLAIMRENSGESVDCIMNRKKLECKKLGYTFWAYKAGHNPKIVKDFCVVAQNSVKCVLVEPDTNYCNVKTDDEKSTVSKLIDNLATVFSEDDFHWKKIPEGIYTGGYKIKSNAFTFANFEDYRQENLYVNLKDYANLQKQNEPLCFDGFCSTACVIRKENPVLSDKRKVLAVADIIAPFGIWIKK